MSKLRVFFKILFWISLLYYVYWLIVSVYYSIVGISSEYVGIHIESLCNHEHITYYGWEGFRAGLVNCWCFTLFIFWFIPLYQVIYLLVLGVRRILKKKKGAVEHGTAVKEDGSRNVI